MNFVEIIKQTLGWKEWYELNDTEIYFLLYLLWREENEPHGVKLTNEELSVLLHESWSCVRRTLSHLTTLGLITNEVKSYPYGGITYRARFLSTVREKLFVSEEQLQKLMFELSTKVRLDC